MIYTLDYTQYYVKVNYSATDVSDALSEPTDQYIFFRALFSGGSGILL